ncbi:MAG TPA: glycosyltransferase [Candidatus Acidoferrales bacterium]|nr:glycosyltransferase [Candidatus Acidoferrales bacterium]
MLILTASVFVFLVFFNRYILGNFLRKILPGRFETPSAVWEPEVTVIVPMYNEGQGIAQTVLSILNQNYPAEKLRLIVVDDCSSDDSLEWVCRSARYSPDRVTILKNDTNVGKRISILNAVRRTFDEIIVSVDSDVVLDPDAIGSLMKGFADPKIGAVGGRIRVRNASQNWLTSLQTIKYYFAYEYFKNIELAYHSILCLSGCLTAYRRAILVELEPVLEDRNILGVPIKYGEDRFLTRQVIKAGYDTFMTHDAVCWTLVPNTFSKYWSQQLRWRRSVLIDFLCGLSHSWKLHPLVLLNYTAIFAMLVGYPILIAQSLVNGIFLPLATFHLMVLSLLGTIYWFGTRRWPKNERVHPLWFLPMAFVLPTIYLILTPLAIFTLDSSSWETRK